jgi:HK97 family phage portal protein
MPWRWPWTRHDRALWNVGDMPAASTYAAMRVTPSTALQHSAVWACVDLIASAISTLPLYAYRRGDRDPLPDLPPLLRQPSATMNLPDWLYAALQSLLLRGNCYGQIVDRAGAGLLPAQVELLAPDTVAVTAEQGRLVIRVNGDEVDPASIWHVKAYTSAGNVTGLSPIAYARQAVGLGLAAEKFGAQFFGDGAIPTGMITTDQRISSEHAEALKERWSARYNTDRWQPTHSSGRGIAVLGDGAKFQPITIPPEESQFLETTRANVATVARYFRVQPELIGGESGGSLTYANVEQRALDFLQFGLAPWLVRLETAISGLLSSTTHVKFNAGALVRTDLLTRYQAHESGIRAGWLLASEVRELEDRPPVAGIDDREPPPPQPEAVA